MISSIAPDFPQQPSRGIAAIAGWRPRAGQNASPADGQGQLEDQGCLVVLGVHGAHRLLVDLGLGQGLGAQQKIEVAALVRLGDVGREHAAIAPRRSRLRLPARPAAVELVRGHV